MAPNPNTRWRSTTRTRPRAGGAQPQYSWRSEKRIFTLTANAALVQYVTVLAAVLLGMAIGLLRNSDAAGLAVWQVLLFALLFGTLCFVAWMAPVGLIASFLRGGRTTARPHDPV